MENKQYAGFWIRLLASLLDGVILLVAAICIMVLTGVPMEHMMDFINVELEGYTWQQSMYVFLSLLYVILLPASTLQGTLGKAALGLKITDVNGERISVWRSLGRALSEILSTIILFIGYIMIAFHREKRGLHDIIARTYVIRES